MYLTHSLSLSLTHTLAGGWHIFLAPRSAERRNAEGGAANRSKNLNGTLVKEVAQEWRSFTGEEVCLPLSYLTQCIY